MTVKYIGNKASQSKSIVSKIKNGMDPEKTVIGDLFSGTGSITAELKKSGYRVHANDYLKQCELRAEVILLLSNPPLFQGLKEKIVGVSRQRILIDSEYSRVLSYLNDLEGEEGFFYQEYSPSGSRHCSQWERKYFTDENAKRIDVIRAKIIEWREDDNITDLEHSLLQVNLIEGVNKIANISGTYGCFLKKFMNNALESLHLAPFDFVPGRCDHVVTLKDVFEAAKDTPSEVVYLDPPFTKRQYATYYHIPETLALEDNPELTGKTGIRPWEGKASEFCYKRKALDALDKLLKILGPKKIYLSYSSDGHLQKSDILDLMNRFGEVQVYEYEQKRFKSGSKTANNSDLHEYLFCLEGHK